MKLRPATRLFAATLAVVGIAAAASIPGCSGCSGKAPLAYVPKDAVAVVLVPSVKSTIRGLGKLMAKFKDEAPVKAQLDKKRQQLVKELGFDPEKPETMEAKGIAPKSGVAFSVAGDGRSTALVFGVADQKALEKYLRETFNKLQGGRAEFKEKKVGGLDVTLLVVQGHQEPRGAWVYHKDHIIICPRSKDGKVAEYAVKLAKQESSIKDNDVFSSLRDKVGKHQVMLYVDGAAVKKMTATKAAERLKTASEWMKKSIQEQKETAEAVLAYFDGAAFGLELSDRGATVRVFTAVPSGKAKVVREVLSGKGDAPDFGEFIGPDALAVGRVSVNLKKLMNHVLDATPPAMKRRLYRDLDGLERQTKINFEKDVLGLLSGRYAMALFGPNADALKQGFSLHRPQQALGLVSGVAMAQVAETKKASTLLATLERMMTGGGMDVRSTRDGETRIYYIGPKESPMVSWTVFKEVLVIGTGDRLKKTLELIGKGGDNVLGEIDSSRAKKLLTDENGNVLYYNLAKTADTIRGMKLPAELKLMLSSVLTTLGKFSDVTWTVEAEDDGVLSELSVRLK